MPITKDPAQDAQQEAFIAHLLDTDEGRIALSWAMVEPIRQQLRQERAEQAEQVKIERRAQKAAGTGLPPQRGINWNSRIFSGD